MQHSYVYSHLKAILQRDFVTLLPKKGLDHVAEKILCYLDANSLCAAELVCIGWLRVITEVNRKKIKAFFLLLYLLSFLL